MRSEPSVFGNKIVKKIRCGEIFCSCSTHHTVGSDLIGSGLDFFSGNFRIKPDFFLIRMKISVCARPITQSSRVGIFSDGSGRAVYD